MVTEQKYHFPANNDLDASVFARVSSEQAGWQNLNMVAMRLAAGESFGITVEEYEYIAVVLSGVCDIKTSKGEFLDVGRRPDVFTGMPYALYMPRQTDFEIEALTDDFAMASFWCPTTKARSEPKLITPDDVKVEIKGGGNATYQVNTIIQPSTIASAHLSVVETYTPGGNWLNFPPHKHDTSEKFEEALEEVIFYKFDKYDGYALQQIYTQDGAIDEAIRVKHNDVVIVPKGYHPAVSAHGYTTYSLHVTAGTNASTMHTIDPRYKWLPETWLNKDPRLPIVTHGMEPYRAPDED